MRLFLPMSLLLATLVICSVEGQTDQNDALADELRLKDAFQNTDGESILAFLRTRARSTIEPKELTDLIDKLADKDAAVRQKACQRLVAVGAPVVPRLRLAARDFDYIDRAVLAAVILRNIQQDSANVTSAAIRLLVLRRTDGAVPALLDYLPHAENEGVLDELKAGLVRLAWVKGQPEPSLLKALEDEHPVRRAMAVTVLCAGGVGEHGDRLRKCMKDSSPSVRFRAAMALAQTRDPKALSTLIALLGELPEQQGREIESFLIELAGDSAPRVVLGSDEISRQKARDDWAKWWLEYDGATLIKEIEKRTLTDELTAKANALIEKLGDDAFAERQQAENELKKLGPMIAPVLKVALKSKDFEIRKRAQNLLTGMDEKTTPLPHVVPRLIALRKPKGAMEAILNYLPFVEDEALVEELQLGAAAVAYENGVPHPALVKALSDKLPVRRAVAGAALAGGPLGENIGAIRNLLKDKDLSVRLRVSLAMASARQPEAVPALISIIPESSGEQFNTIEDYLFRLARDNPPKDLPEGDAKLRDRATAWEKWWDDNKKTTVMVDRLSDFRKAYLGFITLIQNNSGGQLVELGRDMKPRVNITGLLNPWDAQWLNNGRVLVAENNTTKVTERNTKGQVMWEHSVNFEPRQVERMRNGNTFIVGESDIVEIDRNKKEVWRHNRNNVPDIRVARRLPSGIIAILDEGNNYQFLDKKGEKVTKSVRIQNAHYNHSEILDNGNILVPMPYANKVIEYNTDGKEVWSFTATTRPTHAVRLPNKNTLVMSQVQPFKLIEVDPRGKIVREHSVNTMTFRVRYR